MYDGQVILSSIMMEESGDRFVRVTEDESGANIEAPWVELCSREKGAEFRPEIIQDQDQEAYYVTWSKKCGVEEEVVVLKKHQHWKRSFRQAMAEYENRLDLMIQAATKNHPFIWVVNGGCLPTSEVGSRLATLKEVASK
jgi:hypothetical protein